MSDEPNKKGTRQRECQTCGGQALLEVIIEKTATNPLYKVFHCPTCGTMDWIAEAVTPST